MDNTALPRRNDIDMNENTMKNERNIDFADGLRAGIPIGLGYFAVSFAFGLLGTEGGLSIFETVMISATNLTSAGQFAGLNVILAQGSLIELALTQFVINLRYMLMSFSLSQKIGERATLPQRLLLSYGITDEIFAVTAARDGRVSPVFVYGAICTAWPGWVGGTLLGAALGSILPDIVLRALSVALYGMFVAIVMPPAKQNKVVAYVALAACAVSCLFAYAPVLNRVSGGFVIIIVTVLVAGVAAALYPLPEEAA